MKSSPVTHSFSWAILFNPAVIIASLGYFVDIYDLVLFSIVRKPSLIALGLAGPELLSKGLMLLNIQMLGMLIGGIFWGILGDKKGRISILFGSIILYSLANIANGFVTSVEMYAVLRFLAGIGLAGELGAGITLVAEILPKETRGYGTMIIATIGIMGAILANFVAKQFDWSSAYFIGGGLGIMLLILRIFVYESGMFAAVKQQSIERGNFLSLFTKWDKFRRYVHCILIGAPTWFIVGILVSLSPEFAEALGVQGKIDAGNAIAYCYAGLTLGDFASGMLSQYLRSRKKAMLTFLLLNCACIITYFQLHGVDSQVFYWFIAVVGFSSGYWAIFVTIAAEQFGTNLRATVATTVPNFARGSLNLISLTFVWLKGIEGVGINAAGLWVGMLCIAIALSALYFMSETFGKDLNYIEVT
ncbi:MAG: MFS transporter [Bacteroidetes bacterium]|nr:MFS transporter [Bacteroidota bacterium]